MTHPSHPRSGLPPYSGTLTPEHLAVVAAERDRWLHFGLATTPTDRPAAEAAVRRACTAAGLQPPSIVAWMDSPLGGCLATATLQQLQGQLQAKLWDQLQNQLQGQLQAKLSAQLRDQLQGQLRGRLWDQLQGQLQGQLGGQPGNQLRGQLQAKLSAQLQDQLRGQLHAKLSAQLQGQLQGQLQAQLGDQLGGRLRDQLQDQLGDQLWGELWGRLEAQLGPWHESYWLAFYRCALRIARLEPVPRLEALAAAVASLGCWWPLRGAAVLTDRPTILARDDNGRLHADTGPALAWADGYTLHAIHGVRVPARVVEAPHTITVDHIRSERNQEVRRILLDRYGHARFVRDVGAEHVHTDQTGTLWRCPLPDEEPLMLVQVANATPEPDGTRRAYWLRVPPDMRTARQAVAWTFDLDEGDYHPAAQT